MGMRTRRRVDDSQSNFQWYCFAPDALPVRIHGALISDVLWLLNVREAWRECEKLRRLLLLVWI